MRYTRKEAPSVMLRRAGSTLSYQTTRLSCAQVHPARRDVGILSVSQVPSVFSGKKEKCFLYGVEKKCFLYGVAFDGLIGQRLQENNPLKPPF